MSRAGSEARRREAGFTLVELLVVLAILALLVALLPPLLTGARSRAELHGVARELAAGLRETRGRAIASGRSVALVVDVREATFRSGTDKPRQLPHGIAVHLLTTTREQRGEAAGGIRFFADGSSTGGGVMLKQGDRRYDVLVDWLTGRISIEEGNASAGG